MEWRPLKEKRKKDQEMDTQEGVRSTLSPRPIGDIDMVMHSSCMHAHVQTHALKTFMLASLLPLFFPQPRPSHPSLSSSAVELILPRMQIIKTNQQDGRYVLCALLKKSALPYLAFVFFLSSPSKTYTVDPHCTHHRIHGFRLPE